MNDVVPLSRMASPPADRIALFVGILLFCWIVSDRATIYLQVPFFRVTKPRRRVTSLRMLASRSFRFRCKEGRLVFLLADDATALVTRQTIRVHAKPVLTAAEVVLRASDHTRNVWMKAEIPRELSSASTVSGSGRKARNRYCAGAFNPT